MFLKKAVQLPLQSIVRSNRLLHTVVLIRHGESLWNIEKKYTGWCDVPLTTHGEVDAYDAGKLMGERGLLFDVAFTSELQRASKSCEIALHAAGQSSSVKTIKSWKLNERHYGALQGHSKDSEELNTVFGEERILAWRRSFTDAPPSMYDPEFIKSLGLSSLKTSTKLMDPEYIDHKLMHKLRNGGTGGDLYSRSEPYTHNYPSTESLQQCQNRVFGYWNEEIVPLIKSGKRVLIVAHANTIRALVKAVDSIDDSQISHLKIPNGIPLVYTLDDNMKPSGLENDLGFMANYLVSARNHGKVSLVGVIIIAYLID